MSGTWRSIAVALPGMLPVAAEPGSLLEQGQTLGAAAIDPGLVASFALAVLGLAIFAGLFVTRTKPGADYRNERHLAPMHVYPEHEPPLEGLRPAPEPLPGRAAAPPAWFAGEPGIGEEARAVAEPRIVQQARLTAEPETAVEPRAAMEPRAGAPRGSAPEPFIASDNATVDGGRVRFSAVADGTLQLLPGRLEILEGEERGHEVRFVRTRAGVPEITFGRSEGSPHEHVQLLSRTVSREHARMRFDGERWSIMNLSRTNPVVVNGQPLVDIGGSRILTEGDRIEMGEVVFRFRAR